MVNPDLKIITIEKPYRLSVKENNRVLTFIAQQGLPGIPGDGDTFLCEEEINYGDILYFKSDGKVYKASYNSTDITENHIISFFMAQGSSQAGSSIFCRFYGKIIFPNPIFTPRSVYYLGENGQITDIPPTTGLMLVIGSAISETDFFVNIQQPILLR